MATDPDTREHRRRSKIRTSAARCCRARGHTMSRFSTHTVTQGIAKCRVCKMEVIVNYKPTPNETEAAGPALALTCSKPTPHPEDVPLTAA